jgi:hypothetical protein
MYTVDVLSVNEADSGEVSELVEAEYVLMV